MRMRKRGLVKHIKPVRVHGFQRLSPPIKLVVRNLSPLVSQRQTDITDFIIRHLSPPLVSLPGKINPLFGIHNLQLVIIQLLPHGEITGIVQ